jgi:hypothetical protein
VELAATLAVVALAAAFLARRAWRTFVPKGGAAGCGCAGAKVGCPAASEAVARLRTHLTRASGGGI